MAVCTDLVLELARKRAAEFSLRVESVDALLRPAPVCKSPASGLACCCALMKSEMRLRQPDRVEVWGFEPQAFSLRTRRSTS
jgi:hypothetical protein